MKNLPYLACKFELDQSERKSSQVNASVRKPWPNEVANRPKFSTCVYLRVRLARALERKEDRYTSHDIQNEIIAIMANHVIRDLVSKIRGGFFSVICDEYTDISNKEQLTICIRWVDEELLEAHEYFLGFYNVPDIGAETIVSAINDVLLKLQLQLQSDIRGRIIGCQAQMNTFDFFFGFRI